MIDKDTSELPKEESLHSDVLKEVQRLREKMMENNAIAKKEEPFSYYLRLWVDSHFDKWVKQKTDFNGSERRQAPRTACGIPFRYRILKTSAMSLNEDWLEGTLDNISEGGLLFASSISFPENEHLEFQIKLRGEQSNPLHIQGKIVRSHKDENNSKQFYGICFLDLGKEEKKRIGNYVTHTLLCG